MSTEDDLLKAFGYDRDDPKVAASFDDSCAHAALIDTLVGVRHDRDLSQETVADRMGTTQSRVSNFERLGGDPRLSTLFRYARAVDARLRFGVVCTPRGWDAVPGTHRQNTHVVIGDQAHDLPTTWQRVEAPTVDAERVG